MSNLIQAARAFAIEHHGNQKYGQHPYSHHLSDVAHLVEEAGGSDEQIQAAWLHDVLEDTSASYESVREAFGKNVAEMVYAVTGTGHTREEKMRHVIEKIRAKPDAGLVKLGDRLSNVNACITDRKEKLLRRYVNEQDALGKVLPKGRHLELLEHKVQIAKGLLKIGLYHPEKKAHT
jgi:(p)ppGpp synthase/HD superfamily hydrolase